MKKKTGFALVEIVVAMGLVATFLPAIGVILSFNINSSSQGKNFSKAYQLAQEGMEAIIYLKAKNDPAWDWQNTPANTTTGEYYQPQQTGGSWQLGSTTTSPSITEDPFTRTIEISEVRRCSHIVCEDPLALVDQNSRKIIVYVSWPEKNQIQEVKLESYVTAH